MIQTKPKVKKGKGKKMKIVVSDLSTKNLVSLLNSNDSEMRSYATKRLKEIYNTGGISSEDAEERSKMIKRGLGIQHFTDPVMDSEVPRKWAKAASTGNLIGDELKLFKGIIDPKRIPKGRMHPLSGSEPEFCKWLWSGKPEYIHSNNCYAYASNQFRFFRPAKAMPGYNRKTITKQNDTGIEGLYNNMDCNLLTKAVLRDAGDGYVCKDLYERCKKGKYKIIMVVSKSTTMEDFHFYRQDADGLWSHKQGWGFGPTKLDASGKLIVDPVTSDRNFGMINYEKVCCAMCIPKYFKFNM